MDTEMCMFCVRPECVCYTKQAKMPDINTDTATALVNAPNSELATDVQARIFTFVAANGGGETLKPLPPMYFSDALIVLLARLGFAFCTDCAPAKCTECLYTPSVSDLHILFPISGPPHYDHPGVPFTRYFIKLLRQQHGIANARQYGFVKSSLSIEQAMRMKECDRLNCHPCIRNETLDGLRHLSRMHASHRSTYVNALHAARYFDTVARHSEPIPRLMAARQLGLTAPRRAVRYHG